jgi:hypothetical protein
VNEIVRSERIKADSEKPQTFRRVCSGEVAARDGGEVGRRDDPEKGGGKYRSIDVWRRKNIDRLVRIEPGPGEATEEAFFVKPKGVTRTTNLSFGLHSN